MSYLADMRRPSWILNSNKRYNDGRTTIIHAFLTSRAKISDYLDMVIVHDFMIIMTKLVVNEKGLTTIYYPFNDLLQQ